MPKLIPFLLLSFLAACTPKPAAQQGPSASGKPNILILFTDDHRYNTVAALGNPDIRTPNMDRLVASGTAFTRCHTMGGLHGAICAPSRASLLTGRTLFHLRSNGDQIPESQITMPEHLRAAGYATFATGKWHHPRSAFARIFSEQADNIFFGGMHFPENGGHEAPELYHFDPEGKYPKAAMFSGDKFSSEMYGDAAVSFLNTRAGQEQPFFAYVAFTSPHDPRTPPAPYASWYSPDSLPLPPNYLPAHPFDNGELKVRDEQLLPWPRTPEMIRKELAAYYGMISEVDAQIGRILDALEANGQRENTLIVFAGDNGLAVGSHGLLGKQSLYEHSVRIPLVLSGPGIPSGETRDAFAYLSDLFPTLCDMTGLETPSSVFGESLLPVVEDSHAKGRKNVFYAYRYLMRGVRTDDNWKLISYNHKGESHTQLYNLNEDPWENRNVAGDPAYAGKLVEMETLLREEVERYNDPVDLDSPTWGKGEDQKPTKVIHLAVGKPVSLTLPFSEKYAGIGPAGLTDGIRCTQRFQEPCWHAWEGEDMEAVVDLGSSIELSKVSTSFLRNIGSWVFLPVKVEYALSTDGKQFTPVGQVAQPAPTDLDPNGIVEMPLEFSKRSARYVRVRGTGQGECPDWHTGAGGKAWLFVDEIVVE